MSKGPQLSMQPASCNKHRMENPNVGALDGRVIIRFAHAYKSGGGVERYLDDLDSVLLRRNAMTIIRLFIGEAGAMDRSSNTIGRGVLIKLPLPLRPYARGTQIGVHEVKGIQWRILFRHWILYNPAVWRVFTKYFLRELPIKCRPGEVGEAGSTVQRLLTEQKIDLAVLHFFGGADADEIAQRMIEARVPYAVLNHFSNDRFLSLSMRKHAHYASGIASVSDVAVPRYLRNTLINLSDGIDTEFFDPAKGNVPPNNLKYPLILLPARIVRAKGHLDLIEAAALLTQKGFRVEIGFAGQIGRAHV